MRQLINNLTKLSAQHLCPRGFVMI